VIKNEATGDIRMSDAEAGIPLLFRSEAAAKVYAGALNQPDQQGPFKVVEARIETS
jgi:hypothetical protein